MKRKKKTAEGGGRTRALSLVMGTLGAVMWLGLIAFCFAHRKDVTVENLLGYTPKNPVPAALAVIGMFALKSLSMVFSVDVLYALSGILFPLPAAYLVNLAGTAVMVSIPYCIGRKTGTRAADFLFERFPKTALIREMRADDDFLFVLLVRFLGLPCDPVSMYMGAVRVRYGHYFPASMLGLLAHILTFPILGTSIGDPLSPRFLGAFGIQAAFTVASLVAAYVYRKKRRKDREKDSDDVR